VIKILAILALALTACVDQADPTPSPADACGPIPSRGHYTVTYGDGTATLSRADFDALVAERGALKEWAVCMGGTL
jgi:hypothetical protein